MKFVNQIKSKLNYKGKYDIDYIISEIDKYDVISFDIFDTLLKRNVSKPTDVFKYMETKYSKVGFAQTRINAEKKARKQNKTGEITLEEIYKEMPYDYSSQEMISESELLARNSAMIKVFRYALDRKKKVIITSDMYLPESFIRSILKREGIDGFDRLFISSTLNKTKHSGKLFDILNKEYDNLKILHIGDSYYSDYIMPKKKGIFSIHIPTYVDKGTYKLNGSSIEKNILNTFLNNTLPDKCSDYYRFGYEKFGMFLWGYSKWLYDSIKQENIEDIYFFSRDGLIMKDAFDILYSDVNTHYLEVSRRSLRVPILWMNYELSHVLDMISPSKLVSLRSIFDGVGLNIEDYKNLIGKYGFNSETIFDRTSILKNNDLKRMYLHLSEDIEKNSKKEYENLIRYLKQENVSGKIAIVDIGWSGGMQRYLIETLNKLKIESEIKGYYVGVADYYVRNLKVVPSLDLNGYLFDFSRDKNAVDLRSAFVGLFESFFLEQDGSVEKYECVNNRMIAKRLPYEYVVDGKYTKEYYNVKEIQQGALDFIAKFGRKDISLDSKSLFQGIYRTGVNPSKMDLTLFAKFRFFDEGETSLLAIPNSYSYYMRNLSKLKIDFLKSRWKIGFMKNFLKMELPYEKMYKLMVKFK